MCLAKAYQDAKTEEPILEDIAHARIDGDRVELETLLGERKTLYGKVREIDFVNSRIIINS
jgi:predicted RNA-binding protein